MLVLMLGAAARHRLVCSVLLEGGFGETVPGGPAGVAGSLGKGCSAVCSSPANTIHRAWSPTDVHVTPDFVPLSISCLDTLVALLNTALRRSDPRVALRVGYLKLISCLPIKSKV